MAVSTAAILVRLAAAPPLALAWWRTGIAAVVLAPFALRARVVPPGRQRVLLAASGLLLAAHFSLWFVSLELTTVAASSVLVSLSPIVVGAGSAIALGEPPSRSTWIGLVLSVLGAAVIVADDLTGAAGGPRALLGDGLALAAAVAAAGYLLLGRHARRTLPVSVYGTWTYGCAALSLLLAAVLTGTDLGIGRGPGYPATTWLAITGLVVGPQLLGHTVFNLVMARVSATVVAVVIIAEPVGATILAALLLGEPPSGAFYVGTPLVLAGVLLAVRPQRSSATA
ncbi:MAG TPA: DMT family transporter [Euzebyales bacterium]|nr:DMT family transporter [Euzebyales bacterium]